MMRLRYLLGFFLLTITTVGCGQELEQNDSSFFKSLLEVVAEKHLSPQPINDELSKQIFNSFLQEIDPEKKLFTTAELNQLKRSEELLDDELLNGTSFFFEEVRTLLKKRISKANEYADFWLNKEIDINQEVYFESDPTKIDFAKNNQLLKNRWQLMIKKHFVEELYLTQIVEPNLPLEEQKAIALKKIKLFFNNYFIEISSQTRAELLEVYANAYLVNNDYQSQYLSPAAKAEWDAKFSRTFVGVGLSIETTLGYPIIKNVVFDGPAWKTKKINDGDILMKIFNENKDTIDLAGLPLAAIVSLLKGEKGSTVKIAIRNSENEIKEVEIVRAQLSLSLAMSFIIEDEINDTKIGYIYLPRFYRGDEGSSSHILNELKYLNDNKVEGIIFDVRDNKGGAAGEAINILSYFLNGGVVMQAKYANGAHRLLEDKDESVTYAGRLIVLVNDKSSSASELFSGTLQDYKRAIVVGSQTYGKGTIQRFFEITDTTEATKFGDVKLTIGSFYTGNGRSTQYNGVMPDVILTSENKYIKTGERSLENALKFDGINPSETITDTAYNQLLADLALLSNKRQLMNPYFIEMEQTALINRDNQQHYLMNLSFESYKMDKEKAREILSTNNQNPVVNLKINVLSSLNKYPQGKTAYWKSKLEKDNYISECLAIMNDYADLDSK